MALFILSVPAIKNGERNKKYALKFSQKEKMVWWEAVLSPALQVLFDKLSSGDIKELLKGWNINEFLLEKLKIAYFTNTAVIEDAEEKQYNNPAVETWLDMLKYAVYEAEDTLDELATDAMRYKLESSSQTIADQVELSSIET